MTKIFVLIDDRSHERKDSFRVIMSIGIYFATLMKSR